MANPRRSSYFSNSQNPENPFQTLQAPPQSPSILFFLKKPHAFPFLLTIFLFLTWISLRIQHSTHLSFPPQIKPAQNDNDLNANLVRITSLLPSRISKDNRGWLIDPVHVARDAGLSGGAASCASAHLGQIRPGAMRGNHRHHTCNETLVIWGAKTRFRLENLRVDGKGFAEVLIGENEVAVAASPAGTAHALVNADPFRITYFLGCQDPRIDYNSSTTDFNVWKNLFARY